MHEVVSERIVSQAIIGDKEAIAALYERFEPTIRRFLHYRLGDAQTAEDLTTEVFLRMIQALPGYQQREAPFQAWLFQIARNLIIDHARRMNARNHVALDENLAAPGAPPELEAAWSMTRDQLQRALGRLPDAQCEVVVMRFVAGMSIAEVAQTLNRSESAIKALQARGLERLYRVLTQWQVSYEPAG
jgi:RNA polymerase sigma-70 factor (ECF subfamily)